MNRTGPTTWRAVRALRRELSLSPALYIPWRRWRKPQTVAGPGTALLIEGFPRSGNTWTEALIRHTAADIVLAHHSHAAAHVIHAARQGIPVMVLFRDPDAAVQSYLTLFGNRLDARAAYLDYAAFYRATWPLRGPGVQFFSFDDVTSRTPEVIAALNAAFALDLDRGIDVTSEAGRAAVFARMDAKARRVKSHGGPSDSRPGTASGSRAAIKARATAATAAPQAQTARAAARAAHATLRSSLAPEPT